MRVDALADVGDGRVDEVAGGPGRGDAGDVHHEVAQDVAAARACGRPRGGTGCRTGCASGATRPANGVESVWAVARKPSGSRVMESPWLIQTGCSRSMPVNSAVVGGDASRSPGRTRGGRPGSRRRRARGPSAGRRSRCPRTGMRAAPDRRVGPRRARVVDRIRAARQDDRAGAAPLQLGVRGVVGQQLGVDVELADASRDELRELAAEVEDDDGARGGRDGAERAGPPATGRGPARSGRSRGRPRPRRRPGPGPDGPRWPARRGRSCRASWARLGRPPGRRTPRLVRRLRHRRYRPPLPSRRADTSVPGGRPASPDGRGGSAAVSSRLRIASAAIVK